MGLSEELEAFMLDEMKGDKARSIPETGFNVVGVDTFEPPGAQLYDETGGDSNDTSR